MAFGINRQDLINWKKKVEAGELAFLTHYWQDDRFPFAYSVTKVGCIHKEKLIEWGQGYGLSQRWIHDGNYPHYDLLGVRQLQILLNEGMFDHIERFNLMAGTGMGDKRKSHNLFM